VRIAHADVMHVVQRVADVVDARPADADALGHEACAPVQIELAHVGRMSRVRDERQRPHRFPAELYRNEARFVYPARHLAVPEPSERAAQARGVDAVGDTPAGASLAEAHHQPGLLLRAPVPGGENAKRAVIAVGAPQRFLGIVEARRPHQRAIAEHPEVAFRQLRAELSQVHRWRIIESAGCLHAARR